ncbi:MAG: hypothetical protein J2P57_04505 [Acidimicrobiaceae bacterium]|nr:hypothetical protein [Acidimicrobiaceae bacterium]
MYVWIPWVGEVETVTRDDVRALLELPKTVARFNNALATFAESVERFDGMVKRIDRLSRPLEGPMEAIADRLEHSSTELATVMSSLDRVASVLEQFTPRLPGSLSAWRRPPGSPPV